MPPPWARRGLWVKGASYPLPPRVPTRRIAHFGTRAQGVVVFVVRLRGQTPAASAQPTYAWGWELAIRGEHLAEFEGTVQAARQRGHDADHDGVGGRGLARQQTADGGARHAHITRQSHLSPEGVPGNVEHDRADTVMQRTLREPGRQRLRHGRCWSRGRHGAGLRMTSSVSPPAERKANIVARRQRCCGCATAIPPSAFVRYVCFRTGGTSTILPNTNQTAIPLPARRTNP